MLYSKTDDKRYTMMCKEFDEEFPSPNRDDTKLYRTVYLVFYMLACKDNFFQNNFEYYDKYAQFAATTIYVRFLKKLRNGERVKSLLNYAKASKGFLKTMFQNFEFETVIGPEQGVNTQNLTERMQASVRSDYREGLEEDVEVTLGKIDTIIQDIIDDMSMNYDELTKHRIYMSSLLTMLNSVTLNKDLKAQLNKSKKNLDDSLFLDALAKEREKPPILWNLPSTMSNIVRVVVNKSRQELSEELNEMIKDHTLPDDVIDLILANAYSEGRLCVEKDEDYD